MLPSQLVGGPPAAVLSEGSVGLCVASAIAPATLSAIRSAPQRPQRQAPHRRRAAHRASRAPAHVSARAQLRSPLSHPQSIPCVKSSTRTPRSSELLGVIATASVRARRHGPRGRDHLRRRTGWPGAGIRAGFERPVRDRRRSRRSRARAKSAAFDGRTSAVSSSSMRMLETIGVTEHLAEPGCPIRTIAVADGLEPGGLHFDAGRRRAARLDAREPPLARRAPGARGGRARISWLLWKSTVTDGRSSATMAWSCRWRTGAS